MKKVKVQFEEHGESWSSVAFVNSNVVGFELRVDPSILRFRLEVEATHSGKYVYYAFKDAVHSCSKRFKGLRKTSLKRGYMEAEWYLDKEKIGKCAERLCGKISLEWKNKIVKLLMKDWEEQIKWAEEHLKTGKYEGSECKQTMERGKGILKQLS